MQFNFARKIPSGQYENTLNRINYLIQQLFKWLFFAGLTIFSVGLIMKKKSNLEGIRHVRNRQ